MRLKHLLSKITQSPGLSNSAVYVLSTRLYLAWENGENIQIVHSPCLPKREQRLHASREGECRASCMPGAVAGNRQ